MVKKPISLAQAVAKVLTKIQEPTSFKEFAQKVLRIKPSKAKRPEAIVRNHVRSYEEGKTIVFLDQQTLTPIELATEGMRFRVPLETIDFKGKSLPLSIFELSIFQFNIPVLMDKKGNKLEYNQKIEAFCLKEWCKKNSAKKSDSIIFTIENWKKQIYSIDLEKKSEYNSQEVEKNNKIFADLIFKMLEKTPHVGLETSHAIPAIYNYTKSLKNPVDHWLLIVNSDPRMYCDGFLIRYDEMLFVDNPEEQKVVQANQNKVYRFKVYFTYNPSIWRRIEVQGKNDLSDLDHVLRVTFLHDQGGDLGYFWKRIKRGKGTRYREIDLGYVNLYGEGTGADILIAELDWQPKEQLRYRFKDDNHILELEKIVSPKKKVKYPHIIEQNKPEYKTCVECKKNKAIWFCEWCSPEQRKGIVVCKNCLADKHEGHYVNEIVY